jgi:membrane associated rhomboid family serine protease
MIPLRDKNPTSRRTWVTLLLIGINVAVYFLIQPHSGRTVISLPKPSTAFNLDPTDDVAFTLAYAAVPCEITKGRPLDAGEVVATFRDGDTNSCNTDRYTGVLPEAEEPVYPGKSPWLAILTSMFLHGGLLHLGGNMLYLWIFGNNIEDRWGRALYLVFYLLAGLAATLAHVFSDTSSTVPIVGASGAIAGVMGAYLVLFPKARIMTAFVVFLIFVKEVPAALLLAGWFALQFLLDQGGVAWVAHVGGFVFGALVALAVRGVGGARPRPSPVAGW